MILNMPIAENDIENNFCNLEAEQGLLGAILVNNSVWMRISWLNAQDFFEPVHQRIFEAAATQILNGDKADPVVLKTLFDEDEALKDIGGGKYLHKLASCSALVTDATVYAKEILRCAEVRRVNQTLIEGQLALAKGNPQEVATQVAARMIKLTEGGHNPAKNESQIIEEILSDLKKDTKPFATSIAKLDSAMEGGMYPGKAYGICARKKIGKTMLAATISYNLSKAGIKHLFICGEMSPIEIHQRQLARELNVYPSAFRTDYKHNLDFQNRIALAGARAAKNILYQNAPGLTFDQLKMYVSRGINNYRIKGFILDYFQLVGGKENKKSDAMHYDEVAQWIANICRQHDVWALVTAQVNQEGNTRGGEGIRLAFDQVYHMRAPEDDPSRSARWLEMMDTRYTAWMNIGTDNCPGLLMSEKGSHFEEVNSAA